MLVCGVGYGCCCCCCCCYDHTEDTQKAITGVEIPKKTRGMHHFILIILASAGIELAYYLDFSSLLLSISWFKSNDQFLWFTCSFMKNSIKAILLVWLNSKIPFEENWNIKKYTRYDTTLHVSICAYFKHKQINYWSSEHSKNKGSL